MFTLALSSLYSNIYASTASNSKNTAAASDNAEAKADNRRTLTVCINADDALYALQTPLPTSINGRRPWTHSKMVVGFVDLYVQGKFRA
jgi:hypothetical protein